eukprot:jgi/Chlat1/1511/Chrsp12S02022
MSSRHGAVRLERTADEPGARKAQERAPEQNQHMDGDSQQDSGTPSTSEPSNGPFVNTALDTWNERRRLWTTSTSTPSKAPPRRPVLSSGVTYDDILTSSRPFQQRIPLPEMVDFLVDCWDHEGLFN